jgi:Ca-activated chloride channel family protein
MLRALCFACVLPLFGFQDAPPALLRVDSEMVLVPVQVTNTIGAPILDLKLDDFKLWEDGVEQTIKYFVKDDAPVSVGILFDTSASMKNKMRKSSEAAAAFFRTANPGDEFFLVQFGDRARLTLPFTVDAGEIYTRIARTRAEGRTSLLDAIHLALGQMKKARNTRKAIVVVSDGGDNWSRQTVRQVKREVLESDVLMYSMGIFDRDYLINHPEEERKGPGLLNELSTQTGGKLFQVDQLADLPEIGERIGTALRNQYLLGYSSHNTERDGKYRRVQVKLESGNSEPRFRTAYRQGYYASTQ